MPFPIRVQHEWPNYTQAASMRRTDAHCSHRESISLLSEPNNHSLRAPTAKDRGFGIMIRRAHAGQSQREPIWLRSAQMRCPQWPQTKLKIMDIRIAGIVLG